MTDSISNTGIDWFAVTQAAQGLGINTRRLIALHDADQAREWVLEMHREHRGTTAALSYYEVGVMLGHRDPKIEAGASLDWYELLRAVEKVAGAVKAKAAAEKAAEKAAGEKAKADAEKAAAAERAAAEKAAAEAAEEEVVSDAA